MNRRSARTLLAAGVGLVVAALGIWAQTDSLVGVGYDDGIYALLSRAVVNGEGYRLTHLPAPVPGVKYPPVYPLSLTPFWALAGSQESALALMKLANGLYIGVAAGLFVYLLASLGLLSLPLAAAVGLVGFCAGSIMLVTSGLLSEPLYLVLLFGSLLMADRLGPRPRAGRLIVLGVLVGLLALTRTVGLAAVVAVAVGVFARAEGRRWILVAGAAALILAPWLAFSLMTAGQVPFVLVPRYGSYLQLYLANLAGSPTVAFEIFATNAGAILETIGAKLVPTSTPILRATVGASFLGLAAFGSRIAFTRAPSTVTYSWLYLALISLWVFPPFRFVFILFPLLLALALIPLVEVAAAARERALAGEGASRRPVAPALLALLGAFALGFLGYREARSVYHRVWEPAQLSSTASAGDLVDWVRSNTTPETVIAFELDPLIALHTGRRAVPNNYEAVHVWYRRGEGTVEPLVRLLGEMHVDVLAVRRNVPAAAAPIDALLARYPHGLRLVDVTPSGVMIFRTHLEGFASTTGPAAREGANGEN